MTQRSNQEWIDKLRGLEGKASQLHAHEDLGKYLYVVAYNYVRGRQAQANPFALTDFAPEDLAELAQDCVQDTLEKLVRHDYALLDQFRREGKFTHFMAAIARREAAQELRKSYWGRRIPPPQPSQESGGDWMSALELQAVPEDMGPEEAAARRHRVDLLKRCLEQLSERRRLAFWGCVAEERDAAIVAGTLGITRNAVYLLVSRARKSLADCLRSHGVERYA